MTDGSYLIAHDVPLNLTRDGSDAFAKVFGSSPVANGKPLFLGAGYGKLEVGLPAV
jgi:hypothetical protein